MRRVVGAVCIGNRSGSTNFLLQATANKVSRRALLDHMFRLRSTASLRCKHCHFVVPSMFCLQNSTVACDQLSRRRMLLKFFALKSYSKVIGDLCGANAPWICSLSALCLANLRLRFASLKMTCIRSGYRGTGVDPYRIALCAPSLTNGTDAVPKPP